MTTHPLYDPALDASPWRPRRRPVVLCPLAAVVERRPRLVVVRVRAAESGGWWGRLWRWVAGAIEGIVVEDWRDAGND